MREVHRTTAGASTSTAPAAWSGGTVIAHCFGAALNGVVAQSRSGLASRLDLSGYPTTSVSVCGRDDRLLMRVVKEVRSLPVAPMVSLSEPGTGVRNRAGAGRH